MWKSPRNDFAPFLGPVHINGFSFENAYISMRWPCVHTMMIRQRYRFHRRRIHLKMVFKLESDSFENASFRIRIAFDVGSENVSFWKRWFHVCYMRIGRWLLKPSVISCQGIWVFECGREKAAKTIVWKQSFWCVNAAFWKRISMDGALI